MVFKGTKDGLTIHLDPSADPSEVLVALRQELAQNRSFFGTGSTVVINTGGRLLESEELIQILKVLGEHGLTLSGLVTTGETACSKDQRKPEPVPTEPGAKLIRRTLRSGMQVRHDGDVVIVGDLNPGAEVVASGDIVVFGTLRGVVHAGATGDSSAQVMALRLAPTQLRIADLIARSPDEKEALPDRPEVARVKDGAVIIEEFAS